MSLSKLPFNFNITVPLTFRSPSGVIPFMYSLIGVWEQKRNVQHRERQSLQFATVLTSVPYLARAVLENPYIYRVLRYIIKTIHVQF
jgi:hypothetical protein